ncbi:MAG: LPS assembly protein LptD, partial [Verrucomicrobiales bacterium]
TYHQILYPFMVQDWLSLVPRFGVRYTAYRDVEGGAAVGQNPNQDQNRGIAHLGLDASFKISKNYDGVSIPKLGVDGLKHISQPYVNYSFNAGDDLPEGFAKIDRYAPTTRLRPLDQSLFPAIDEIGQWNIVRTGMRNRLLTRRDGEVRDWFYLDTYFDSYIDDNEFDRNFSNLFNNFTWRPLDWLALDVSSQLPVFGDEFDFTEINTDVRWQPWRHTEFTIGHRNLADHPFFEDSSLLYFYSYTRLNDNWGFSMRHRYELDDSIWEMQQYSIHRDLSSWTMAVGGMILDNRGQKEYGFVFSLSLKDFPRLTIPFSIIPGSESQGR